MDVRGFVVIREDDEAKPASRWIVTMTLNNPS